MANKPTHLWGLWLDEDNDWYATLQQPFVSFTKHTAQAYARRNHIKARVLKLVPQEPK